MQVWLLGAGAVVLVGIAIWIVWPARNAGAVGVSVQREEGVQRPMTESVPSGLPPQGDRFEDQYTSATADLSAGGVAAALQAMHDPQDTAVPAADRMPAEAPPTPPLAPGPVAPPQAGPTGVVPMPAEVAAVPPMPAEPTPAVPTHAHASFAEPETGRPTVRRSLGLGAGAVLALGGGMGGAWLYARWLRRRNKPINRLRRGARDVASRLGERIPDVDELPRGAAPMSGAATALLLTALLASRALRSDASDAPREAADQASDVVRGSVDDAVGRARDIVERGREQSRQLQSRIPREGLALPTLDDARQQPAILGIGLGGLAVVAGGAYVVWRLLRDGEPDRSSWYAGE
ncbi:MAG: hypothetical protein ACR2IK_23825 [Chloroflexota bacterium]